MKRLLILATILLLAMPVTAVMAKGVAGIGLGYDVKNVHDPGFSAQAGLQEELAPNHFIRVMYNKFNYGNTVAIDNIGATYIYMLGLDQFNNNWDIGLRLFGDAETETPHWGYGFGLEFDYLSIKLPASLPFLSDVIGDSFGAFAALDVIHQPVTSYFLNLSLGITFFKQ